MFLHLLYHAPVMVYDAEQMTVVVGHQYRVDFIFVHDVLYLADLGLRRHDLGGARHDVADGLVEELGLPFLHGASYVAVGYESGNASVLMQSHAHAADHHDDLRS